MMRIAIVGIIWGAGGKIAAAESLAARMADRELARMAEARRESTP